MVVVNPNNPTGSYLKRQEQNEIASICARHRLGLIADEVFADYSLVDDSERAESISTIRRGPLAFSFERTVEASRLAADEAWVDRGYRLKIGRVGRRWRVLKLLRTLIYRWVLRCNMRFRALLGIRRRVQAQIIDRLRTNLNWLREKGQRHLCVSVL